MITLAERLRLVNTITREFAHQMACDLRVSLPGIIEDFDASKQTATVRLAIREKVNIDFQPVDVEIPLLLDVPIVVPRAGGYIITLPVKKGDECLVLFSDMCINSWFTSGGVQNQERRRRHDLSDSFAILGPWSQPRVLDGYSQSGIQIRSEDGETFLEVIKGQVHVSKNLTVGNGATGSFTSSDGKTVTVQDGIVVNIQ
jgi:hypothetical protein